MSRKTFGAVLALAAFAPATALAGAVMLKNKDGRETTILVKRSNSTTETAIAARATMELPGAPMTITVKKTGAKIDAVDGDTVVIEKGKLTKLRPEPEEGEEEMAPSDPATPEETPAEKPAGG